jgi:hypothetical protein
VPLQTSELAQNMTVYVTLPDGTKTTLGPFTSDITGGTTTIYTPQQTGNYSFYMTYGGQTLTLAPYAGDYDEPSQSLPVTLTVQSTSVSNVPFTPLPTQYWQTPINAENVQNWDAITGPWLGLALVNFGSTGEYNLTGNYNPYTTGPTTGHILWTKPWSVGGVAGGDAGNTESSDYWTTSQYEPKWAPVVIEGIEYATWYTTSTGSGSDNGIVATNLYNGQTMWIINTTDPLRCGMVTTWETVDQYGVVGPFILTVGSLPASQTGGTAFATQPGSTQYNVYDALTGNYVCSVVNGTSVQMTVDSQGDLIGYYINNTVGTEIIHPNPATAMVQTNTGPTLCAVNFTMALGWTGLEFITTLNSANSFGNGINYATPIPTTLNGVTITPALAGGQYLSSTGAAFTMNDGVIVLTSGNSFVANGETAGFVVEAGFNQYTGANMWIFNRTTYTPYTRINGYAPGAGVYCEVNLATFVLDAYYLSNGELAWSKDLVTASGGAPNTYDEYDFNNIVDSTTGIDFWWALGGDVWAINMTNGNILWYTNTITLTGSSGTETPYGVWPLWVQYGGVAAGQNSLLYLSEGHEYSPPLFHGAQQLCINMTNGQLVWSQLAFDTTCGEISYGIMTSYNCYDGQIYAYGQGPSATTVNAPNVGVTTGTPIDISGTVMDVSAGASQEAVKANFPNGLPCVSDASMAAWMEYVYEQQPHPTSVTGVTVDLTSIDPNGNTVPIGTATSDASGYFHFAWTPPIAGSYTIIATFQGSGAYYGSYAETSVYAGSPPATPQPTASPISQATTQSYILGIGIALIVIVIIVGAVLAILLLRKRP